MEETTLIERDDDKTRTLGTVTGVHGLIIFGDFLRISRSGNENAGTTGNQSLQDLRTNRSSSSARDKDILILKRDSILCGLFETIEIQSRQSLIIFPTMFLLLLQMQEWNGFFARTNVSGSIGHGCLSRFLALLIFEELIVDGECPVDLGVKRLDLQL